MRWTWWHFAVVLVVSVSLSAFLIWRGVPFGGFFLLLPLVFPPMRFGRKRFDAAEVRRCPKCGVLAGDPAFKFCPRDGTPLD